MKRGKKKKEGDLQKERKSVRESDRKKVTERKSER